MYKKGKGGRWDGSRKGREEGRDGYPTMGEKEGGMDWIPWVSSTAIPIARMGWDGDRPGPSPKVVR